MKINFKKIIMNFSFVILSNFVNLFISSLAILIIPKIIGIVEYGYWQLYTFYIGYVGFFHLGWPDGLYLKFGGQDYSKLDKKYFSNQFVFFNLYLLLISLILLFYINFVEIDVDRKFIYFTTACNIILLNLRVFFVLLLQATNEIKKSSLISIIDRIIYAVILLLLLLLGSKNYKIMIFADVFAKFIGVIYAIWICKDKVLFLKNNSFNIFPVFDNIKIGINLMLSNVASMLIIGVIRLGIEKNWSIEVFGKISLTLSISNLIMIFINAIGIVVFPILKNTNSNKLSKIYISLRDLLMPILFLLLVLFYPLKLILHYWLTNYSDALAYMALVFPMAIFEGKMALLINTYMKTLRMENNLFKINLLTLIISIFSTYILTITLHNLELTVSSIVILLAFRGIIAEIVLSRRMNIKIIEDLFFEIILTIIFIVSGWFLTQLQGFIVYLISFFIYLILKRNKIFSAINFFIGSKQNVNSERNNS